MGKIKDWSLDHHGQSTGVMTQNSLHAYLVNVAFTENMHRDIEEYLIREERTQAARRASKAVKSKKIVVTKRTEEQDNWAYDEMIDARLTLAL